MNQLTFLLLGAYVASVLFVFFQDISELESGEITPRAALSAAVDAVFWPLIVVPWRDWFGGSVGSHRRAVA